MKMPVLKLLQFLLVACFGVVSSAAVYADTLNVAVASNFSYTLKLLSSDFEKQTGHQLRISSAATGKLYTQITNGAPFDVFLSADELHAELLVANNYAEAASEYVYATGQIVLLSNIIAGNSCVEVLSSDDLKRLSIANPKSAPYGAAAKQVLEKLSLWAEVEPRIVKGENIAQTLQFVTTKNAQAGFVAKSMLNMGVDIESACIWEIPTDMYSPIKQKMVLLSKSKDNAVAKAFFNYIKTPQAKAIIRSTGYDIL